MEQEHNYPEVTVTFVDDDSDIDVHIVGEGMYAPGEETANDTAEFIDIDSDGEIDAVLIDVGMEQQEESEDTVDDALPELESAQTDDEMIDSDMQGDMGDADLDLV